MKPTSRALALAVAASLSAGARAGSEDDAQAELLAVMQQETEIATKTRMNADFVPGIVTILEGDQLRALGARTVWDAMPYVPGVRATLDNLGTPTVVVRGVQFPFNSGSIQILLNGSPIARESAGGNGAVLLLPLIQVERVEFIRGPGSVLYGDFAFQGLLNIVTRSKDDFVALDVDDAGAQQLAVGANGSAGGWDASVTASARGWGDSVVPVGNLADERRESFVGTLRRGEFQLQAETFRRRVDDGDRHPPNFDNESTDTSIEARYELALAPTLKSSAHLQYLHNDITNSIGAFRGDQWRGGWEANYSGLQQQNWVAGVEYTAGNIDRAIPPSGPPPGGGPPPTPRPIRDKQRDVYGVYVQDQIEIDPSLRATLGARYDHSSETGERVTPRAALVWQAAEHHVLKAQYAEGSRAPTFFELYTAGPLGNGAGVRVNRLDFEVNRTLEFNYVYERPHLTARATVFRTHIDDMIFVRPGGFGNVAKARADGAELELSQQLGAQWRLDANLSYVDAHDSRNLSLELRRLPSVPYLMGNLGLLWTPLPDLVCGLHWNHVGPRDAVRDGDGEYDLVDLSVTRRHAFTDALDLQFAVQNVSNERVVHIVSRPEVDEGIAFKDRVVWGRATLHW